MVGVNGMLFLYAGGWLGGGLDLLLLMMFFELYLVILEMLLMWERLDMLDLYDLQDIAEMDLLSDLLTETDFSE
jgi:hypothetical protein